jgi:hypothetical protein
MSRLIFRLLLAVTFTGAALTAVAEESVCAGQNVAGTAAEIVRSYQRYQSRDELAETFLKNAAGGFDLGIQGYPAHLRAPSRQMTEDDAGIAGFNAGYRHGLALYCSMKGRDAGYRTP